MLFYPPQKSCLSSQRLRRDKCGQILFMARQLRLWAFLLRINGPHVI